jgi:hypothetical protein
MKNVYSYKMHFILHRCKEANLFFACCGYRTHEKINIYILIRQGSQKTSALI